METLSLTLALYRSSLDKAARAAAGNWPVLGSMVAYALILGAAARFAMALGLIGGFLLSAISSACIASFLYLVEVMVRGSRVTFDDFAKSFAPYFWDVVGVTFVLWVFWQVVTPLLAATPQGVALVAVVRLLIVVFLNAVPELIYLGHHSSTALVGESYSFIVENWLEWFAFNGVLVMVLLVILGMPAPGLASILQQAALALFAYFAMVARGFLFRELSTSTRRSRLFRHRSGQ